MSVKHLKTDVVIFGTWKESLRIANAEGLQLAAELYG